LPARSRKCADYEAEPPVESSWNDEPIETEWVIRFGEYLNKQTDGPASWAKVMLQGDIRARLDLIHSLTSRDSPERKPGRGFALQDRRQLYSTLKERYGRARRLLLQIEELTSYRHPNVVDDHTSQVDWPRDREEFAQWIAVGKEITCRLQEHFKSISHASREEKNDERFLITVFVLRHKCFCTHSEVGALIASGMAAYGRIRNADEFDQWKVKDDLKRLQRTLPDLYKTIEDDIKGQQSA
jgi:hypothetical protein